MAADSDFIQLSLKELIMKHTPNAELSGLDDIVVSYVVGVVEDAVAGEEIDVEGVKELVAAYEPSFNDVPDHKVDEWIASTVLAVRQLREKGKESSYVTLDSIVSSFACETKTRVPATPDATSEAAPPVQVPGTGKQRNFSSSSGSSSEVETLLELFPDACRVDVERYLHTTAGDVQEAICLMLDAPPCATLRIPSIDATVGRSFGGKVIDDKTVKATIMSKYGFIDHDEDRREHRPLMPKWESKKMIRYRDNKVVSLKGERYTEIKKEEPEDLKKTYVNLKPGRQYRFH